MSNKHATAISGAPLLRVEGLRKSYRRGGGWHRVGVDAVSDVDREVRQGSTTAIVGESGAGKSTLARCVARLEKPDAGAIWLDGIDWAGLSQSALRPLRAQVQLIFQDPTTAFNPRVTAEELISEPLWIQRVGTARSPRARARELMAEPRARRGHERFSIRVGTDCRGHRQGQGRGLRCVPRPQRNRSLSESWRKSL